jgi:hypothetical protein
MSDDFDLPEITQQNPPCPKCGAELLYGFGLAGGGFGSYEFCSNDDCEHFKKEQVGDDE